MSTDPTPVTADDRHTCDDDAGGVWSHPGRREDCALPECNPVTSDDLRDQVAAASGLTPGTAGAVLRALETHEVMADVADALRYIIETSEYDTTRFERTHRILFPNFRHPGGH